MGSSRLRSGGISRNKHIKVLKFPSLALIIKQDLLSRDDVFTLNAVQAILEKSLSVLQTVVELRSIIQMNSILEGIKQGFEEIFTISGILHVVDFFVSPAIPKDDAFVNAEKEVVLAVDSIDDKQLKILSGHSKVTYL